MLIAILSDSHGDILTLDKVNNFLRSCKVEKVFHLGDNIDDTDDLDFNYTVLYKVPGTRDNGYEKIINRSINLDLEEIKFSFSHVIDDCAGNADILIYGHSHVPKAYIEKNKLYLNPGHIINNAMRHPIATFMLIEIVKPKNIKIKILSIDFDIMYEKDFILLQ